MKQYKFVMIGILGLALVITGCGQKSQDQASLSGMGIDSLATTEELAQLPQAGSSSQQGAIEVLPIENSPVTQGIMMPSSTSLGSAQSNLSNAVSGALSRSQQIQTALKNAGLYTGSIDGKIGPASTRAIKQFQENNGLTADGKVGPKTWAFLEPYINGTAQSAVGTIQTED